MERDSRFDESARLCCRVNLVHSWKDALPQEDALTQIDDLASKVAEKSFEYLKSDRDLQAIFERRFEILGEAFRRLERTDPRLFAKVPGARDAIDMRNIIAHGYDGIDHRVLWEAVSNDLPLMRATIIRELAS